MIAAAVLLLARVDIPGEWTYVTMAYVATFVTIVAYVAWVMVRGRKVNKQVPPEERRWM